MPGGKREEILEEVLDAGDARPAGKNKHDDEEETQRPANKEITAREAGHPEHSHADEKENEGGSHIATHKHRADGRAGDGNGAAPIGELEVGALHHAPEHRGQGHHHGEFEEFGGLEPDGAEGNPVAVTGNGGTQRGEHEPLQKDPEAEGQAPQALENSEGNTRADHRQDGADGGVGHLQVGGAEQVGAVFVFGPHRPGGNGGKHHEEPEESENRGGHHEEEDGTVHDVAHAFLRDTRCLRLLSSLTHEAPPWSYPAHRYPAPSPLPGHRPPLQRYLPTGRAGRARPRRSDHRDPRRR